MTRLSVEEKIIWNKAVKKVCREILKWDGVIPYRVDRENMAEHIQKKLSFKRITQKQKA